MHAAPPLARARQALAASMLHWAQLTGQQQLLLPAAQLLQLAPTIDAANAWTAAGDMTAQYAEGLQEAPPQLPPAAAWAHAAALATSKAAARLLGAVVPHGPQLPALEQQRAAAASPSGGNGGGARDAAAASDGRSGPDLRAWAELQWPQAAAQLAALAASEAAAAALPRCMAEAAVDNGIAAGAATDAAGMASMNPSRAWGVGWRLVSSVKATLAAAGTPAGASVDAAVTAALRRPLPQPACTAVAAMALAASGGGPSSAAAVLAAGALDSVWSASNSSQEACWQPTSQGRQHRQPADRQRSSSLSRSSRSRRSSYSCGRSYGRGRSYSRSRGRSAGSQQSGSASSWTLQSSGSRSRSWSSHSRSRSQLGSRSRSRSRSSRRSSSGSSQSRSPSPAAGGTDGRPQPGTSLEEPEAGEISGEVAPPASPAAAAADRPAYRLSHLRGTSRSRCSRSRSYSRRLPGAYGSGSPTGSASEDAAAAGWDRGSGAPSPAAVVLAFEHLLQPLPSQSRCLVSLLPLHCRVAVT